MKTISFPILAFSLLAACSSKTDLTADNLGTGMQAYLQKRGDLCLAKNTWPIDVTQKEMDANARNALQMPVLEKLGLVQSSIATVTATEDGRSAEIKVKRYELTAEGKKYYLNKEIRSVKSDGDVKFQAGDLCAAKLSLEKIAGWEQVQTSDGTKMVSVSYTYKIDPAPWMQNSEAQQVFPMVARVINGAGSMQLQESFKLTEQGWVAVDL
jgi:hypothetical protein